MVEHRLIDRFDLSYPANGLGKMQRGLYRRGVSIGS
jgi:hypothetical protein